MKFNNEEKLAIINKCNEIIHADGKVHREERITLLQIKHAIGYDSITIPTAADLSERNTLITLNEMTLEKKQAFSKILKDIALSDKHLHLNEILMIADIFENIGFDQD